MTGLYLLVYVLATSDGRDLNAAVVHENRATCEAEKARMVASFAKPPGGYTLRRVECKSVREAANGR